MEQMHFLKFYVSHGSATRCSVVAKSIILAL